MDPSTAHNLMIHIDIRTCEYIYARAFVRESIYIQKQINVAQNYTVKDHNNL